MSEFLTDILDRFSKVTEFSKGAAKLRKNLVKTCGNNGLGAALEETKTLVESLFEHSRNLKDEFFIEYDTISAKLTTVDGDESSKKPDEVTPPKDPKELNKKSDSPGDLGDAATKDSKKAAEGVATESSDKRTKEATPVTLEDTTSKLSDKEDGEDTQQNLEEKICDDSDVVENDPLGVDNDVIPNTIDSTQISVDNSEEKTDPEPFKPSIKLVDINKLVDPKSLSRPKPGPKSRKSVQFDSSVITISTSSEDESIKETRGRRSLRQLSTVKPTRSTRNSSLSLRRTTQSDSETDVEFVSKNNNLDQKKVKNGSKIVKKRKNVEPLDISSEITSASSSDEQVLSKKTLGGQKSPKKAATELNSDYDWKKDVKFESKCYVRLLRVPCEEMKGYYFKKAESLEIKKLTNMKSLKRLRSRKKSNESNSSSDGDKRKPKKTKRGSEKPSSSDEKENDDKKSESEEVLDETLVDDAKNELAEKIVTDVSSSDSFHTAQIALDGLNSDKESVASSASDTEAESKKKSAGDSKKSDEVDKADVVEEAAKIDEADKSGKVEADKATKDVDLGKPDSDKENTDTEETSKKRGKAKSDPKKSGKETAGEQAKSDQEESRNEAASDKAKSDKEESESDCSKKDKSKSAWKKDKLLTTKLSSSDSEDELRKFKKKKKTINVSSDSSDDDIVCTSDKKKRAGKKRLKKVILVDSDSDKSKDSASDFQLSKDEGSDSSSDSEKESSKKDKEKEDEKSPRKRVRKLKDSSEDDDEKSTRKQIRRVWGRDSLAETTKKAEAEEKERKARIADKQKKYNLVYEAGSEVNAKVEKVVLDFDEKTKEELLKVDEEIVEKLKPHQAAGIQFMWDACFESLDRAKSTQGSGCILAHCMGLGKTLQVIALTHALLVNNDRTGVKKVMVVCPLNTVLNWVSEYKQWMPDEDDFEVYELVSFKQNYERQYQVKEWHKNGGVLIIGYDMYRNLSNPDNKRISKKMRSVFQEALVDPGPDLVICDEGHLLKNEKTNLSIAMNRLKTMRRIVLTGTPLQNNLKEYFCMVQFIKPNLLGTYKEYLNRFVNPITNGQYTDSTPHDIQIMRKRSHVLHKMLDGVVQRRDYSVLQPYLPPKHEYVLFLSLSDTQIKLYEHYMHHFARRSLDGTNRTSFLFVDFQNFQRICTHPRVLLDKSIEDRNAKDNYDTEEESEGSIKDFINDDDGETSSTSSNSSSGSDDSDHAGKSSEKPKHKSVSKKRMTRAAVATAKDNNEVIDLDSLPNEPVLKEWWQNYCDGEELDNISHSAKLFLLFAILKESEEIGDKVLVFSQSLYSLNIIEYFLGKIHDATQQNETFGGHTGSWCPGLDYFRLDGSSSCDNRSAWCKTFNSSKNTRARLFLISTKAGGLGINLVAANRVIIFDVSWNPSHDVQSIYRVYRFGQTKPCYIYRFVTNGTMEMKIYERQVTKQAISKRVIDEQQIDRHYNQNDLAELYKFDPRPEERPIPLVPKDVLLGELLQKYEDRIYKYHEHQSLLENKEDEGLNEEERKAAWEEFENEKIQRSRSAANFMAPPAIAAAIMSLVQKDNPTWTEQQIRMVIPGLTLQLQEQVAAGDLTMYHRVTREMRMLQALQNQRLKEQYLQQQALKLFQQQQGGGVNGVRPNPMSLLWQNMAGTSVAARPRNVSEVIDLND